MQWWTLQQLKSRNARTRLSAVEKLAPDRDPAFLGPLVELLSDPDAPVRAAAADALGRSRSPQAVKPLAHRLSGDTDPDTRRSIIKALQEIGSPEGVPALVEALPDPVGDVGWQAARALQSLRWEPANRTERAAWHLAVGQFDDAVSFGAAAVEPLAKLTNSVAFQRCIRAVESLARVGGAQSVKPLLDCLFSKDFTIRSAAASALGEVGDARAVDPLVHALRDMHHQVCLAACISLGKMGDQRAVESLINVLQHSAPDVRTAAVAALGKLRDSQAVPPVVKLLEDSDTDAREAAATALGLIGDEQAIEHLVLSLTDPHSTVRQAAAGALRRIEPYWERSEAAMRAIPRLQIALKSNDYWVRHSAADTLKKLGVSQEHESKLLTDSDGALQKRQAAQSVLVSMLSDRDRNFRQAAAEALGRIGLADSIGRLVERLSDSERGVQFAAARSLETLRWQPSRAPEKARQLVALEKWSEAAAIGAEAVDAVVSTLAWNDALIRRRAIDTLVQIGGAKAISALRAIAADPQPAVSNDALSGLAVLEADGPLFTERQDAWGAVPTVS